MNALHRLIFPCFSSSHLLPSPVNPEPSLKLLMYADCKMKVLLDSKFLLQQFALIVSWHPLAMRSPEDTLLALHQSVNQGVVSLSQAA